MADSSHREHAWWRDYKERGIYLITIVVKDRQHLFGELNNDVHNPYVLFTDLGKAVQREWLETIAIQHSKGRAVRSLGSVVMPDHFHGVLFVEQPMDVGLGEIIRCFKLACTQARNRLCPPSASVTSASSASLSSCQPAGSPKSSARVGCYTCMADLPNKPLSRMSHHQREAYYTQHPEVAPFFDDNYDDSICYGKGQLDNIIRYVQDNPRRAVMRAVYPHLFTRRQHIIIADQDYAAYGNLFLLRRPWKEQVFCHRWRMDGDRRDYSTPYETTPEFARERELWLQSARLGAVLVTPGISKGEQQLLNDCLDEGLPLIHLQSEPIPPAWNPPIRRHKLCEQGKLLILSPWQLDEVGEFNGVPADTQYSRFHNQNTLAQQICASDISLSLWL